MVCGHCGTSIKPGYKTCSACGAMYAKQSGCLGRLFGLLAVLLIISGVVMFPFVKDDPGGGLLLVDGSFLVGGVVIVIVVQKTAPYKWFRKL